jgi:hypothetical protein
MRVSMKLFASRIVVNSQRGRWGVRLCQQPFRRGRSVVSKSTLGSVAPTANRTCNMVAREENHGMSRAGEHWRETNQEISTNPGWTRL